MNELPCEQHTTQVHHDVSIIFYNRYPLEDLVSLEGTKLRIS